VYIQTYIRTHGWTFETGFIGSTVSKSRPKNGSRKPDHGPFRADYSSES